MTAPASPLTYAQAAALAAAIHAGGAAAQDPVAAVAAMSEKIIGTRDTTAAWAKSAIRQLWASVDPYDDAQVLAFARQSAALMESAQTAAARVAAAGQAQQLATAGIVVGPSPSNPVDVRAPGSIIKRGQLMLHQHAVSVDYTGVDENAKVSKADMTTQGVFGRPAAVFRYAKSIDAPDPGAQAGQRIDSLIDDNLMLAQRLAQQQVLVSAVDLDTGKTRSGPKVIGYRRVIHPERSRGGTCGMCIAASDRVYHVAQLMPIHAHCVPGDSLIGMPTPVGRVGSVFRSALEAATRRKFEGELVEFVTASGNQVRITANHPVLTDQGWIPAGHLGIGDTVFRRVRGQRPVRSGPQVDQRPALAENVFRSVWMVGGMLVRMPVAAEDFHGDWSQGEVEIVRPHSDFPTVGNIDQVSELGFMDAELRRMLLSHERAPAFLIPSLAGAAQSFVGRARERGTLFGGAVDVPEVLSGGITPRLNAPSAQFTRDSRAAYAERGCDLLDRLSGEVEADCIVEYRLVGFSGHVYNFQTAEGWYEANNCIVSNCQCTIAAVTEDYDPADDLNAVDLNQLYKQGGGTSVAHLKRTRYQVDEHGELGPVLVPKSKYKPQTTKSKVRVGGTALQSDQPAQADIAKHQIGVLEANLAKMRADGVPEDSSKITYHQTLIAKLRKQIADDTK